MRDKLLHKKRNETVKKRHDELYAEGLRTDIIYDKLKEEFHLTERTIYAIVSGWYDKLEQEKEDAKKNKNKNQKRLFE